MVFTREITHSLLVIFLGLFAVLAGAVYWSLFGGDALLARDDNPRAVLSEAAIRRGSIYDRNGIPLVEIVVSDAGTLDRIYRYEALYSTLGYFSLRYGTSGIEATFDDILRGDRIANTLSAYYETDVLHRPQMGEDIQLTLDLSVQQRLATLMADHRGAAVVLSVPDGDVLALLSQPTYNPNTLNDNWEELIEDPAEPFFNRALVGQYQPGGAMQTPLILAAILTEQDFSQPLPDATTPVQINDLTLRCTSMPVATMPTLAEAYAHGCPQPFNALIGNLSDNTLTALLNTLRLHNPPAISSTTSPSESTPIPTTTIDTASRADWLGQGQYTVNPLGLALLMAAITNEGNAPQPRVLAQTRAPNAEWLDAPPPASPIPLMTSEAATRLENLLRANLNTGIAAEAARATLDNGGHAALAFSGDVTHVWFVGFVTLADDQHAVIALVLEDSDDTPLAATIGTETLAAAVAAWEQREP